MGDFPPAGMLTEASDAVRLGALLLTREPRRSPREGLSNLLSLNSDAFISRGLGVLKMERVSLKRALWTYQSDQPARSRHYFFFLPMRSFSSFPRLRFCKCRRQIKVRNIEMYIASEPLQNCSLYIESSCDD